MLPYGTAGNTCWYYDNKYLWRYSPERPAEVIKPDKGDCLLHVLQEIPRGTLR